MNFFEKIIIEIAEISILEIIAVVFGIAYLLLIARKNRWGWWLAFISSAFYVLLSYQVNLYLAAGLQLFYVFMAVYGWIIWNKSAENGDFIVRWSFQKHAKIILFSSQVALLLGFLMSRYTQQESAYLDAFATVFSLSVTFMAAHRVLENWLYWIVIDAALVVLYASQGLYLIGLNYFIYTIIAIFAFISWKKSLQNQEK